MAQIGLAVLHLLALAIGLPAVVCRAWALGRAAREADRGDALGRAFGADTLWGAAAALWIATGLWRYLAGTERDTDYYDRNHLFLAKMAVLVVVLIVEIGPMVKLIRWRIALRRGAPAEGLALPHTIRRIAVVSWVEAALVVVMVILAVAMARGRGAMPGG